MELRQLRYVEAVARHRHFTRAAEELHVAQSALSHQVRRLESELGLQAADLVGERRLGDVQLLGGTGEVSMACDGLDISQLAQLHA